MRARSTDTSRGKKKLAASEMRVNAVVAGSRSLALIGLQPAGVQSFELPTRVHYEQVLAVALLLAVYSVRDSS